MASDRPGPGSAGRVRRERVEGGDDPLQAGHDVGLHPRRRVGDGQLASERHARGGGRRHGVEGELRAVVDRDLRRRLAVEHELAVEGDVAGAVLFARPLEVLAMAVADRALRRQDERPDAIPVALGAPRGGGDDRLGPGLVGGERHRRRRRYRRRRRRRP